jgi:F-type H+-transporting ATPase subunit a
MNINVLGDKASWSLLSWFGITHPFFNVIIPTVVSTWVILGIIFGLIFLLRRSLANKESHLRFCVLEIISALMDMVTEALGHFTYKHFSFIASLFFFILICNTVGVLPFLDEPTTDLNTTVALGIIGLLYRDFFAIREHGLHGYLKEFFEPLFFMFPLHIMGKFSSLISISFRLFGNILGGMVISHIWFGFAGENIFLNIANFCGLGLIINLFFGIFEGLIQAFVFAMLSLTYLSLALAHEEKKSNNVPTNLEKVIE